MNRQFLNLPDATPSAVWQRLLIQRYRAGGTPRTAIIDRDGIVRFNDIHIQSDQAVALIDRHWPRKAGDV